jgi:hypothetical protein
MDNVDRMYRHLVRTIRSRFPQYLTQPFEVGELAQTILPYRHHRRELGIETNEDYEIALTELLSGARDYLVVDDHMADVLRAELASVNPDPAAFKQFAHTTVSLSPGGLLSLGAGPADELSPPRASGSTRMSSPTQVNDVAERPGSRASLTETVEHPMARGVLREQPLERATPRPSRDSGERVAARDVRSPSSSGGVRLSPPGIPAPGYGTITPHLGDRCPACDEGLPAGRAITFCPHCGQNITTTNCPACGSELEIGWKFCPSCGRPAAAAAH